MRRGEGGHLLQLKEVECVLGAEERLAGGMSPEGISLSRGIIYYPNETLSFHVDDSHF